MTIIIRDAHGQLYRKICGKVSDAYRTRLEALTASIGGTLEEIKPKSTGGAKPADANWNWTGGDKPSRKPRKPRNQQMQGLSAQLRMAGVTQPALAQEAGVSRWTVRDQLRRGAYSPQVIAAAEKMLRERAA